MPFKGIEDEVTGSLTLFYTIWSSTTGRQITGYYKLVDLQSLYLWAHRFKCKSNEFHVMLTEMEQQHHHGADRIHEDSKQKHIWLGILRSIICWESLLRTETNIYCLNLPEMM
jgi:hypothetical protein